MLFSVLGGFAGPLISDDPNGTIYSARSLATDVEGAVFAQIVNGSDGRERTLVLHSDRSPRMNNDFVGANESALRARLVASGDTLGAVFLTGAWPPQPTTSTELNFLRAR